MGGGASPCKPKSLNFLLLLDITPTKKLSPPIPSLITNYILEKRLSLIAFTQILPKIFLIWKSSLELKPFIQNSVQQDYLPELCPNYPPKHLWETLGMGENPTQQLKNYLFPPPEKSPLINSHLPLSKVSFFPHKMVIFI